MNISGLDKREAEIAELVVRAPLRNWLVNPSFEEFYQALRRKSKDLKCPIENLLDSGAA